MPGVRQQVGGIPVPVQQAKYCSRGLLSKHTHARCRILLQQRQQRWFSALRSVRAHTAPDRPGESLQGISALSVFFS